jgi:hypothetical protein
MSIRLFQDLVSGIYFHGLAGAAFGIVEVGSILRSPDPLSVMVKIYHILIPFHATPARRPVTLLM